MAAAEDIDYYAVLNVPSTATLQEIKTAYRQRSLKVHPDRNPDNPDAAALFHSLRLAAELLMDPIQRSTFDSLLAARNARTERFKGLNSKRKALVEDLHLREQEFKKSRGELDEKNRGERNELERLKEEGKKLREDRDRDLKEVVDRDEEVERIRKKDKERKKKEEEERVNSGIVELGPLDLMIKLKFTRSIHSNLISPTAITNYLQTALLPSSTSSSSSSSNSSNSEILSQIDTILLSPKFLLNPLKGKYITGMISFKSLTGVVKFMEKVSSAGGAGGKGKEKEWEGIELTWAAGTPPTILGLGVAGAGGVTEAKKEVEREVSSFPTSMLVDGDEERILALLRAKERAKLIADLEREDAEAEAEAMQV